MRGMCIYCIYICILDVDFIYIYIYMFFFLMELFMNYGLMDIHNYVLWI